ALEPWILRNDHADRFDTGVGVARIGSANKAELIWIFYRGEIQRFGNSVAAVYPTFKVTNFERESARFGVVGGMNDCSDGDSIQSIVCVDSVSERATCAIVLDVDHDLCERTGHICDNGGQCEPPICRCGA